MSDNEPVLAIIGGGPRGISVLERIAVRLSPDASVQVHIYEPCELGSGRVWQTDQPQSLVMNTYAGQVTFFVDDSVHCAGAHVNGPDLITWARLIVEQHDGVVSPEVDPQARAVWQAHPAQPEVTRSLLAEARALEPWSHPSRVFFGRYLQWFADRALALLPSGVHVMHHRTRATAVDVDATGGRERYRISASDGTLIADAAVLALGWLDAEPGAARVTELPWVAPENPIEQRLDQLGAGESVAVRGLGMGFYDALVLLTEGRGGRYEPVGSFESVHGDRVAKLRYVPSGREPQLQIGSASGVPFRSKSVYHALPPQADLAALDRALAAAVPGQTDFDRDLWPALVDDARRAWATTRARLEAERGQDAVVGIPAELDLQQLTDPLPAQLHTSDQYARWFVEFLTADVIEAAKGLDSPLKAAAWTISAARARIAEFASFGGLTADSFRAGYARYMTLGAKLGSGPPAFRTAQLLAAIEAGIVHPFGPAGQVRVSDGRAELVSPSLPGEARPVSAVLDAWMYQPDAPATADPLLRHVLDAGVGAVFARVDAAGTAHPTRALAIEAATSRLLDASGEPRRALYSVGVPQEEARGFSAISPLPNTDSALLRETDAVADDVVTRLR